MSTVIKDVDSLDYERNYTGILHIGSWTMTGQTLFEPYALGSLSLSNRIVMGPLNPATLYGGGAAGYTDYPTISR
ncbi:MULTISPECIES: hypothetical protein [Pseudomonas]|uniref:hypothetical protein n=1 Tax=Pseudomonas sp. Q12-87 TaxID=177989 RepID=UPI0005199887|nr:MULTISPECIES: hypothetical protein [Pseudomonas]